MLTKFSSYVGGMMLLALPALVSAQTVAATSALGRYLQSIISFINGIIIPFILGVGFLFFIWGIFLYFIKGGDNDEAKQKGKSFLVYAVAGFVIIFIFWGVINLIAGSTGLNQRENTVPLPIGPGASGAAPATGPGGRAAGPM